MNRPQEGVKIAATDEEAKAEAAAPAIVDIDVQANQILRYASSFCENFLCFSYTSMRLIYQTPLILALTQLFTAAYLTVSPDLFCSTLPVAASVTDFAIAPIEFDKDIDAQMRVVAAVSNLRARNYAIPEADLHVSRGIAGKITPAIATTTAMVTGTCPFRISVANVTVV